jgi:hypothetical protein
MQRAAGSSNVLWAITAYFNPARYWNRRQNYRVFRQYLNVPLATVEMSSDGQFELDADDANILIRKSGGDVMWQKERLLNLALEALPPECQYVLWLDCDVIFLRANFAEQVCRQLEHVPLVQPFSLVHHLPPAVPPEQWKVRALGLARPSVAWRISQGISAGECLGNPLSGFPGIRAPGHAWAARRELLTHHSFYDACIIGGGDSALACAAYGVFDVVPQLHADNEASFQHYLQWAEPFYRSVQGHVSLVTGDLLHLWHGEMSHRRTRQRHRDLASYQFDPATDIALSPDGCWCWNSPKWALHEYVANYFFARNEDSVISSVAAA